MNKCLDCNTEIYPKSLRCKSCNLKFRHSKITRPSLEEKQEKRKSYKAKYFQENKERILLRRKNSPISREKSRQYNFKYSYGVTLEEYEIRLQNQDYKCLICESVHDPSSPHKRLYIDHDHVSGKVRGLLCQRCNSALGLLDDSRKLIQKAMEYLSETVSDN